MVGWGQESHRAHRGELLTRQSQIGSPAGTDDNFGYSAEPVARLNASLAV
jgi:hypothetical protein